jgi:hypothetical protein
MGNDNQPPLPRTPRERIQVIRAEAEVAHREYREELRTSIMSTATLIALNGRMIQAQDHLFMCSLADILLDAVEATRLPR